MVVLTTEREGREKRKDGLWARTHVLTLEIESRTPAGWRFEKRGSGPGVGIDEGESQARGRQTVR
jgi:hypothetical protein